MRTVLICLLLLSSGGGARADALSAAFGGLLGFERLTRRTLDIAVHDPRIAEKFDDIDLDRLSKRLALHLCALTGGGCTRHGPSMKGAHEGLGLTDLHFNALVEDMQRAMDDLGIPFATQNRLLALIAPSHRDVVSR